MPKATYRVMYLAVITGILLMVVSYMQVLSYSAFKLAHVVVGFALLAMVIRLAFTHVPTELDNPFKRGIKKWNGMKLLFYLSITILSGIFLLFQSWIYVSWVVYLHVAVGLWCLLVGRKHTR